MPSTIRLHRVVRTTPEKSIEPSLKRMRWRNGCRRTASPCNVHHLDGEVGGTFKMSFTNFTNGQIHAFGGT